MSALLLPAQLLPAQFAKRDAVPAPRRLGKYIVTELLGEGAMGTVFKAIDPHLNRAVALKTIRKPLAADAAPDLEAALRFRNEAQAAGRLGHPGIVSVYEFGEDGADMFIAMEFVHGQALLECTERGQRLPTDDVVCLMAQLLDALHHAHEQGVWHRDIKPANLMVTPDGRLKITDFGIARIDSAEGAPRHAAFGSPGYMAPERYTGEAPGRGVDIFSCGVLLYELLAGAPPFMGSADAIETQVLQRKPPAPSQLPILQSPPAAFDAVVAKAMAKSAADRYPTALAMREALVDAAGGEAASAVSKHGLTLLGGKGLGSAPTVLLRRPVDQAVTVMAPRGLQPPAAPTAPTAPAAPARPATAPAATTTAPAWDAAVLGQLEVLLLPRIGPIARTMVRQAARHCHSLTALTHRLANDAVAPDERSAFLAQAAQVLAAPAPAPAAPARRAPPALIPVLGSTPLPAHIVEQARALLVDRMGPIASIVVKRAAAGAPSREQFFSALADGSSECLDRRSLLADLWRLV